MNAEEAVKSGPCGGPLHGVRVLDLTTVVLGPVATQILGDYGADVVKVEAGEGDLMRANGVSRHPGMSSIFLAINRNKRSITLDLKQPEGRRIFLELAQSADVLVHNMRVPAIERLGLGYSEVKAVNPSIVYCAATGFGQDGPDRGKPAFDDIVQAASGMASLLGESTGEPVYVPALMADKTTGMAVVNAVLAALVCRERTGRGQYVEVPMLETMVEFNMAEHMGGMAFEPPMGPPGYARIMDGGRRPVRSADGHVAILPYTPAQWQRLFKRVGREDLYQTYDLSDRHKLNENVRKLYAELADMAPLRSTADWIVLCEELDIPATPIYSMADLPEHPHLKSVGLFEVVEHPTEGRIRQIRPTARFADTPSSVRSLAPVLGEHTVQILKELGYADEAIADLCERAVTGRPLGNGLTGEEVKAAS